jgi:hypothetical protein
MEIVGGLQQGGMPGPSGHCWGLNTGTVEPAFTDRLLVTVCLLYPSTNSLPSLTACRRKG